MYKYQSKCKFRMLTTIGDRIIEIRPKQIIESDSRIDNSYLVPLNKKSDPNYTTIKNKEKQNGKPPEQSSKYSKTKT